MKKIMFFAPLVLAALAGCSKVVVEDDPIRMDPDHITYVKKGVSLVAGAGDQSRVSFDLVGDGESYSASRMAWEAGDIIKVWYNGKIRRFVTTTAGRQGTFYPITESDVISKDEFDPSNPKKLIAYYNVSSVESDGTAGFTIAAVQTEGEASNKIPLYENIDEAVLEDNQIVMVFKPMASVVDFSVSAGAAAGKDGSGNQLVSFPEGFSYKLTKVVLTPDAGASGWTTGSCTFDPSDGTVSSESTSLSAITFNFADTTEIAIEDAAERTHFQMIVGKCRLNECGATMDWYKGELQNYTRSIWATTDVNLTGSSPKFLFQGLKPKAVGLYDYNDYDKKFYRNRAAQDANYINICDDERNVILTGDIDMGGGDILYFNRELTWGFDGRGHCFKNFEVTNYAIPAFFNIIGAGIKNLSFGDGSNPASFDITDASNNSHFGPIIDCKNSDIRNVTSYVDYTLTISDDAAQRFLGGIVGRVQKGDVVGCTYCGSLSIVTDDGVAHSKIFNIGGIIGRVISDPKDYHTRITSCSTSSSAHLVIDAKTNNHLYCAGIVAQCQSLVTISGCCNEALIECDNAPASSSNNPKMVISGIISSTSNNIGILIKNSINLGELHSTGTTNVYTAEAAGIIGELNPGNTVQDCGNGANLYASGAGTNNITNWYVNWASGTVNSGKVLRGIYLNGTQVTNSNYNTRYIWSQSTPQGTLTYVDTVAELEELLQE